MTKHDRLLRDLKTLLRSLCTATVSQWWVCPACDHERRKRGTEAPVCSRCLSTTGAGPMMEVGTGILIVPVKRRRRRRPAKRSINGHTSSKGGAT